MMIKVDRSGILIFRYVLVLMIVLGFCEISIGSSPCQDLKSDSKERIRDIDKGNWRLTLTKWTGCLKAIKKEDVANPAMAITYIEVATQNRAYSFYENASQFYLDNLEKAKWTDGADVLTKEIKRILPIVPVNIRKQWEKEMKHKNPNIFREIVSYWSQVDPVLTTKINERLMEHWERIGYARKHFTKTHTSVYGTDDRGLIYVKYGSPYERLHEAIPFHGVSNPLTGLPIAVNGMEIKPRLPLIVNFDLWSYQFSNRKEPSYYLFGKTKGNGRYKLQPGILSIIPSYGYHLQAAGIDSRGGRLMINYGILEEVKGMSAYFDELYNNMTRDMIIGSSGGDKGLGVFAKPSILYKYEQKQRVQSKRRDELSPSSTNEIVTTERYLPVNYQVYRFLNKENRTEYIIAADPYIYRFRRRIRRMERRSRKQIDMTLRSILFTFDSNGKRHFKKSKQSDVLSYQIKHPVLFTLNADSIGLAVLMGMDLLNNEVHDSPHKLLESGKKSLLIGSSGPLKMKLPSPLPGENQIVISDPVLGYAQETDESKRIPFYPAVNKKFRMNGHMMVYFEAYHIKSPKYLVEYRFDKFRAEEPKGKVKPYKGKAAVTVEYNTRHQKERHSFSIDLKGLTPGWYQFVMTIHIPGDKTKIERRVSFQIVK